MEIQRFFCIHKGKCQSIHEIFKGSSFYKRKKCAKDNFYKSMFKWLPGNLTIGPNRHSKDPGEKFDEEAAQARLTGIGMQNLTVEAYKGLNDDISDMQEKMQHESKKSTDKVWKNVILKHRDFLYKMFEKDLAYRPDFNWTIGENQSKKQGNKKSQEECLCQPVQKEQEPCRQSLDRKKRKRPDKRKNKRNIMDMIQSGIKEYNDEREEEDLEEDYCEDDEDEHNT